MRNCSLKRVVSFVLSLVMVLGICLMAVPSEVRAAEGGVLTINASGTHRIDQLQRGDTVTITAVLSDNEEASGVNFKFRYDSDILELQGSPTKGTAYTGANLGDLFAGNKGEIGVAIAKLDEVVAGTIFTANFRVKDNAKGNVSTQVADMSFTQINTANSVTCDVSNNASGMKVVVPATGISFAQTTESIAKGSSKKLTPVLTPADADSTVSWTSSNAAVATVSQDGTVTAVGKGTAVVTATAEGKKASCTVNVTVPLQSISISGTASTIKKGTTATLTVTYDPADTTDSKDVTWQSSDPDKATVRKTSTSTAVVEAIADGNVTITATAGGKSDTYAITVKEVKLTGIAIKNSTTIHKGEAEVLDVTYLPEDTTDDKTVTWSTSDAKVATVDGSGKVTAIAAGNANITAEVGSFQSVCAVRVDVPLKKIIPAEASVSLVKNQTKIINYTLSPADTTDSTAVTFSSDNQKVATVNASTGEITAVAEGTAVITLSGANGITAKVTVKVTEIPINSIVINKTNAIMEKAGTVDLTATIGPGNTTDDDKTIKWESSDPSVVTVGPATTNSGQAVTVTATNKGGKATITATAGKGKTAKCEITVLIHLEDISTPASVTMNRKATQKVDVTFTPADMTDDRTVTWSSDNKDVATVDPKTGTITAVKKGTANITATTTVNSITTGKPATATTVVDVQENHLIPAVGDKIAFSVKSPVLKNQSLNMYNWMNLEELKDANQITDDIIISWFSSDESVASVDQSGCVTGLKKGKTTITAVVRSKDGAGNETGEYTATAEIEIKEIPLDAIAFSKVVTKMQVGAVETLGIIYHPDNTTDLREVIWISSDPDILSVENGKLTARKVGKATITAKVGTKSVSCEITVIDTRSTGGRVQKNASNGSDRNGATSGIRTGDTANFVLYVVAALISLAAAVGIFIKIKSGRRIRR